MARKPRPKAQQPEPQEPLILIGSNLGSPIERWEIYHLNQLPSQIPLPKALLKDLALPPEARTALQDSENYRRLLRLVAIYYPYLAGLSDMFDRLFAAGQSWPQTYELFARVGKLESEVNELRKGLKEIKMPEPSLPTNWIDLWLAAFALWWPRLIEKIDDWSTLPTLEI